MNVRGREWLQMTEAEKMLALVDASRRKGRRK